MTTEFKDEYIRGGVRYLGDQRDEFRVRRTQISAGLYNEKDPAKRRALLAECAVMGHLYMADLDNGDPWAKSTYDDLKCCLVCNHEEPK